MDAATPVNVKLPLPTLKFRAVAPCVLPIVIVWANELLPIAIVALLCRVIFPPIVLPITIVLDEAAVVLTLPILIVWAEPVPTELPI